MESCFRSESRWWSPRRRRRLGQQLRAPTQDESDAIPVNRIRTIATAGIVAGSVAFAAALLSSGGVGASFVDAAEAGASITVANSFEGPAPAEPTPSCTVASDRAGITF